MSRLGKLWKLRIIAVVARQDIGVVHFSGEVKRPGLYFGTLPKTIPEIQNEGEKLKGKGMKQASPAKKAVFEVFETPARQSRQCGFQPPCAHGCRFQLRVVPELAPQVIAGPRASRRS